MPGRPLQLQHVRRQPVSRISKTFNEQALQYVVENISEATGWLIEIVNLQCPRTRSTCAPAM